MATAGLRFSMQEESCKEAVLAWWRQLEERRGDRAELRRCRRPLEIFFCQAYHRLRYQLLQQGVSNNPEPLAAVVGLLAHLDEVDFSASFAGQMAANTSGGDRAVVSGLRFRRLLQLEQRDDLYHPLIRVLQQLGRRANLYALAGDVYFWGPLVRKHWALD